MTIRGRCRAEAREQAASATLEESLDPERIVEQRQIAGIVAELVEELDDEIRRVVRLRYFEGHSAAEIARLHAVPAGTVRWRLKVGLDRLRQQLDARYGGKRALWAGAFAPVSFSPTLATGTASKGSMVATAAATTQGSSTMFVKSLIAKLLIGSAAMATAAGALALTTRDAASSSVSESSVLRTEEHPALVAPPERRVPDDDARIRWAQRVEAVREARARQSQVSPTVSAPTGASGVCVDEACVLRLAAQLEDLVRGCEELSSSLSFDVTLNARVVAAADVGAVVEHVELSDDSEAAVALRECLTESMYTFELELDGELGDLEQEITIGLRSDRSEHHEAESAPRTLERSLAIVRSTDDLDPAALAEFIDAHAGDGLNDDETNALLERLGVEPGEGSAGARVFIVQAEKETL